MFACQLKKNTCIVSKIDHVVVASHTYATHSPPKKTWNTGKIVWTCLELFWITLRLGIWIEHLFIYL